MKLESALQSFKSDILEFFPVVRGIPSECPWVVPFLTALRCDGEIIKFIKYYQFYDIAMCLYVVISDNIEFEDADIAEVNTVAYRKTL